MSCEGCPSAGNCSKQSQGGCQVQPAEGTHIKHCIAIMSGKGGVGKSTVTVLLARALQAMGKSVGIMDADITGPSIPRLMDLNGMRAYGTPDGHIIPVEGEDGIKIMSLNYLLEDENEPVVWRGPIVSNVVKQFFTDVNWGELDYLLIDMPPGTGDVALTILQDLPVTGVVMVSTPQPMVSMIVTKAIRMCEKIGVPVLGVVENMAYLDCPHCHERISFYNEDELKAFLDENKVQLYGLLPNDQLIRDVDGFHTIDLKNQENTLAFFKDIAEKLVEDVEKGKEPLQN